MKRSPNQSVERTAAGGRFSQLPTRAGPPLSLTFLVSLKSPLATSNGLRNVSL